MTTRAQSTNADRTGGAHIISVRTVLRLMWEADRHPILGNEDVREANTLEKEALDLAARAVSSPDDPPEFIGWLTALRKPTLRNDQREVVMEALYELFDPDPSQG